MKKLFLLVFLCSGTIFGQECEKLFKIQDKKTHLPIDEVVFLQGKSRFKNYSTKGQYPLAFKCNEILLIDSPNYYRLEVNTQNLEKDTILIELLTVSYNLKEVIVKGATHDDFIKSLSDSVMADLERNEQNRLTWLPTGDPKAYEKYLVKTEGMGVVSLKSLLPKQVQHPITAIANLVYRKQIKRQAQTAFFAKNLEVFREKYNKDIVSRITGFTGEKLKKFMDYCKPDFEFVVNALAYEIYDSILKCQIDFKE